MSVSTQNETGRSVAVLSLEWDILGKGWIRELKFKPRHPHLWLKGNYRITAIICQSSWGDLAQSGPSSSFSVTPQSLPPENQGRQEKTWGKRRRGNMCFTKMRRPWGEEEAKTQKWEEPQAEWDLGQETTNISPWWVLLLCKIYVRFSVTWQNIVTVAPN